jgi:hypothetical protein
VPKTTAKYGTTAVPNTISYPTYRVVYNPQGKSLVSEIALKQVSKENEVRNELA